MVPSNHCVCTLEYWLWNNLKSFSSDTMHIPISIGCQWLMHFMLIQMFEFTAQLNAH